MSGAYGDGGGGALTVAAGFDGCRPLRRGKAASWAAVACCGLLCSLVLQGCDFFSDPDEVEVDESIWTPKELKHTPLKDYTVDLVKVAQDCSAATLHDSLTRIRAAFYREAQATIAEDVPEKSRTRHLAATFPEDPFQYFVLDKVTGYLNKDRVYCRIVSYFPEMEGELQDKLFTEEVQGSVSRITQFLEIGDVDWDVIKVNSTKLEALKRRFGLEELSDAHFVSLRSVVMPLEEEFLKAALFLTEAFGRGVKHYGGCLRHYFEVVQKDAKCFWDVHSGKEVAAIGSNGIEVVNRDALLQAVAA